MCNEVDISYSIPAGVFLGSVIALAVAAGLLLLWYVVRLLLGRDFIFQIKSKDDIDTSGVGLNLDADTVGLDGEVLHDAPGQLLVAEKSSGFKLEALYPYILGGVVGAIAFAAYQVWS